MPASVIADGGADVGGKGIKILKKFLGGLFLKVRVRSHGLIEIVDVGGVMFVVVERHGLRINIGFESVRSIRQRRKGEGTGGRRRRLRRRGGREQASGESSNEESLEEGAAIHGPMFKLFKKSGKLFV